MSLAGMIPGDVYERTDWGAPSSPGGSRRAVEQVEGMTIHHTTGATLGQSDTASWVYNIYRWHTGLHPNSPLSWADIGYAYLVDRFGNVFVGRGRYRQLAHATGFNRTWLGVAFLGTGQQGHVSAKAKEAFVGLYDWLRGDGGMVNLSKVNGHRDIGDTGCPDEYLYQWAVVDGMPLDGALEDIEEEDEMPKRLVHIGERGGVAYDLHYGNVLYAVGSHDGAVAITGDEDWYSKTVVLDPDEVDEHYRVVA